MTLRLPDGYYSREPEGNYVDGISNVVYQPLVYKAAAKILKRNSSIKYVIDIGCGNGIKLKGFPESIKLVLADHEAILEIARSNVMAEHEYAVDLESGVPDIPDDIIRSSLIIFSDVVEHIEDPSNILRWLSEKSKLAPCVIISTPDRVRERGTLDIGPPANKFHIREWSLDEFVRLLADFGFPEKFIAGYTIDNTLQKNKNTIFVMSGKNLLVSDVVERHDIRVHDVELLSKIPVDDIVGAISSEAVQKLESIDSDWFVFEAQFGRLSAVPVNKTTYEQICQADLNGFDALAAVEVLLEFPREFETIYEGKEKPWVGKFYVPNDSSRLFLAAIKKQSLIKLLKGDSKPESLKFYPYTMMGFDFCDVDLETSSPSLLENIVNCFKSRVVPASSVGNVQRDSWHENNSRLEYVLELTLQVNLN